MANLYYYLYTQEEFVANLLGFVVALMVSVFGHTFLTFRENLEVKKTQYSSKQKTSPQHQKNSDITSDITSDISSESSSSNSTESAFTESVSTPSPSTKSTYIKLYLGLMLKQALVGLASFGMNNVLLYLGMQLFPQAYALVLFVTLLLVAVITFLVTKYIVYFGTNSELKSKS